MTTITDWLKSLDLQVGDRIVDGERTFTCHGAIDPEDDEYGPQIQGCRGDYAVVMHKLQHPEHWRRIRVTSVSATREYLHEDWQLLSRYDDWAKEQNKAPKPWAEVGQLEKRATVHPIQDLLEAAWPEIERRVKKMMGEK